MRKINHLFLLFFCLVTLFFSSTENTRAQKPKQPVKKKKPVVTKEEDVEPIPITAGGSMGGVRESSLILEPCAKETPEQIAQLENAANKNVQVEILVKRVSEKDDWLRSCSIYRLGEFRDAAQDALPVIIKLIHDEQNSDVWLHAETALWKIPPKVNVPLAERIRLSKEGNIYQRLEAIYTFAYFKPIPGSFEARDKLKAFIENVKDEDTTIAWLSVMGIRQFGSYGINTADAIPAFSDILKNGNLNPIIVVRAIMQMGENALPIAPLLFDILYNPTKYIGEKDKDSRAYGLYLTTGAALGKIGKPLLPLLEKEIEKQPIEVLQVLRNLYAEGVLPILFKAMKHSNPEVRKKAIESLPGLTSIGALETLPYLLTAMNDADLEVIKSAINKIGSIARNTENKLPELQTMLKKKAVPALIAKLNDKELSCYAALNLGDFGADAETGIPALVRQIKKEKGNGCAEKALFDIGEKGKKHLTKEQIERIERYEKIDEEFIKKAKPIKPKTTPKPTPAMDGET